MGFSGEGRVGRGIAGIVGTDSADIERIRDMATLPAEHPTNGITVAPISRSLSCRAANYSSIQSGVVAGLPNRNGRTTCESDARFKTRKV